ncbi:MAC/perforin domain-containing protein [Sphingobacterium gobiense]|uniref:MAC/perforin domain-containing protein n=1 Tax=Sphingobacterium gobiense TaxID=1382456 RepID=UPI0015E4783C|nr:MAC/perforin domain-containing protein [Sphingobacterium gobiense]
MLLCVVGLAASCNKEMATPESVDSVLTDGDLSAQTVRPLAAGMGPYDLLGYGYDVLGQYANAASQGNSIIDIERLKNDHPNRVIEGRPLSQEYTEEYGENAEQYSRSVSNKASATAGFKLFGWELSSKFNYENNDSSSFDGKYIYGSYNLVIKQKRYRLNAPTELLRTYLTDEFSTDLSTQSAAYIVRKYGPFVLTDIYTGGKFDMKFQSETRNSNRTQAARIGIKVGAKAIFDVEVDGARDVNTSAANQNFSKKLSYSTLGGDPTKELRGVIDLDASAPKINIKNWQNSVTPENSVLVDFGRDGLIPIYELVADASKRSALKSAFENYLENGVVKNVYKDKPVYILYIDGMWLPRPTRHDNNHVLSMDLANEYHSAENRGIAFYAYDYQVPGTLPVYRYLAKSNSNNFYTLNPGAEYMADMTYEGIAFYAYPNNSSNSKLKPVHRWYSQYYTDHYYSLVRGNHVNYEYEGVKFYVPR